MPRCPRCGLDSRGGALACGGCGATFVLEATIESPVVADERLRAGQSLGGYILESEIARGGMGVVYRARDEALGRTVALKVIAPDLALNPSFRQRFEREWRAAARLEHPHVVAVYRAGEDDDRLFLAMRFIEGHDLATEVAERGRLPAAEAAEIISQVGWALDTAHAQGLVHRDVKPANILLSRQEGAVHSYLADFGLTVNHDAQAGLTRTGQLVGTVAYLAPERIRGGKVDALADVYALGGVLHYCLTGSAPYPVAHDLDALSAHLSRPPPKPSEHGAPRAFDEVVASAMAKDTSDRTATAGDVGRAALHAAGDEAMPHERTALGRDPAVPPAERQAASTPSKPHSRARVVALSAFVIVAVLLAVSQRERGGPEQPGAARARTAPIKLPLPPVRVAAAGGFVWTATESGRRVRVNPLNREVSSRGAAVDLAGGSFPDLAAGAGGLWTTQNYPTTGGVTKYDARTGQVLGRTALGRADLVAVGADAAFVTTSAAQGRRATLVRISGDASAVDAGPVRAGKRPADVAVTSGAVWLVDVSADRVTRLDPRSLRVIGRTSVGARPALIAASERDVWIASDDGRELQRLDPRTGEIRGAAIRLGKEVEALTITGSVLWVAAADATVTRLDAASGQPRGRPVSVGAPPLALAADGDGVWVASDSDRTLQRLE